MSSTPNRSHTVMLAALLVLATACAFVGVARNDFIRLDDPIYVYENEAVMRALLVEGRIDPRPRAVKCTNLPSTHARSK